MSPNSISIPSADAVGASLHGVDEQPSFAAKKESVLTRFPSIQISSSEIINPSDAAVLKTAMDSQLHGFLTGILATERGLVEASEPARLDAEAALQSFLLSFASRAASRERLRV